MISTYLIPTVNLHYQIKKYILTKLIRNVIFGAIINLKGVSKVTKAEKKEILMGINQKRDKKEEKNKNVVMPLIPHWNNDTGCRL